MGKKLVPKVILEGTRLTHKTELAFTLNSHPRFVGPKKYRYHSPIVSAEWCAFTNIPWGRGLVNYNEEEEAKAMETYRTWVRLFELQRYFSWTVDRFHISTKLYQRHARGVEVDFRWLEQRLDNLGFHVVLLTRDPDSFEEAREERLKVSGYPAQYDDLQPFIDEQDEYRELAKKSLLPAKEFNISGVALEVVADRVCDWLESTGGLYAKE